MDPSIEAPRHKRKLGGGSISEVHDECADNTLRRADVESWKLPALHDRFAIDSGDRRHVQRGSRGLIDEGAVRSLCRNGHKSGRQGQKRGGEERE